MPANRTCSHGAMVATCIGMSEIGEHLLGVEAIVSEVVEIDGQLMMEKQRESGAACQVKAMLGGNPDRGCRRGSQSCDSILPGRRFFKTRWRALQASESRWARCVSRLDEPPSASTRTPPPAHPGIRPGRSATRWPRERCHGWRAASGWRLGRHARRSSLRGS